MSSEAVTAKKKVKAKATPKVKAEPGPKKPGPKKPGPKKPAAKKKKTDEEPKGVSEERGFDINERYAKKTDLEHVLLRPDTYVGGVDDVATEDWVLEEGKIIKRRISYSPAMMKIFDEILVNARDHSVRDETCNRIRVNIEGDQISVENNGDGIAVEVHESGSYLPEMLFGHFKSGENFNDGEEKTVGGRNGLGATLCVSADTFVPTWNGELKKACELKLDDKLIGDDGSVRHIESITIGHGKMFEVSQGRKGEVYQVNDQHILTLHMPDHKVIYWNAAKNGWSVLWWDHSTNTIKAKTEGLGTTTTYITCPECGVGLAGNMGRHYSRVHKGIDIPEVERRSPTQAPETDTSRAAYSRLEFFCKAITDDNTIDISIQNYLKLKKTTQSRLAGIRSDCVQWPAREVSLDPYLLGLWLGDGSQNGYGIACCDEIDPDTIDYLKVWCEKNDARLTKKGYCDWYIASKHNVTRPYDHSNPLKQKLAVYNLINNKHIPHQYLVNDRDTRLKVLAGLIDSDGHVSRDGTRVTISQGMMHRRLAEDIRFLARSLGYFCSFVIQNTTRTHKGEQKTGQACKLQITGDLADIPTRLPRKKCANGKKHSAKTTGKIDVRAIEDANYVGVSIDGNKRFLINDFTVTHNCNAFSTRFEVDTVDKYTKKRYVQVWENNMSVRHEPTITSAGTKQPYTKITFVPDFQRLGGAKGLSDDFVALAKRRVYDLAACTRDAVLIYLNGEKLPVRTFEKYTNLYLGESKTDVPRVYAVLENEEEGSKIQQWDICVALSDDGFKQVSFVNGIATSDGGTHVAYIRDQLTRKLGKLIRDNKRSGESVKPEYIRENMWLFVNAVIVNPAFSSQTKESLTTKPEKFGFKHNVKSEVIETIEKRLKISRRAIGFAELRKPSLLARTDGRKTKKIKGILKLEDAVQAGGRRSAECTLILTEGDSAKTMAMDGLQIIGRELYGVFPLKGKPLNVRNATEAQLATNEERNAFKKIMGLSDKTEYTDASQLRYGSIMLMTDQDFDGYHIKGVSIANILNDWPCLLKIPGFIKCFVTPIVKLQPTAANSRVKEKLFFNMSEFEAYRAANPEAMRGMKPRYLKGLGTSERKEALAYFADFERFVKVYQPADDTLEQTKQIFQHAFDKSFADWRKTWLSEYDANHTYDYKQSTFPLEEYVDRELKHFSIYDNQRSLGNVCDGLKISQRKVLWAMRKMGLWSATSQKKVLAISGEVSSVSGYHHGEKSLMDTMIGMAQTFVNSNNVNLLYPSGQFGSRMKNGSDASDPRYIYTRLNTITRFLFRPEDDAVLRYESDDEGKPIEPTTFAPIIAMVLVNGCDGIGTGYSTTVPKYDPMDVIDAHIQLLEGQGEQLQELLPWYRNYGGTIERVEEGAYVSKGVYQRTSPTTIMITEVPVGQAFEAYKEFLETHLIENAPTTTNENGKRNAVDKSKFFIASYVSNTYPTRCQFEVTFPDAESLDKLFDGTDDSALLKKLKLSSSIRTSNMYLFTEKGAIRKFVSTTDIIRYYHDIRLALYTDRKAHQLQEMQREIAALDRRRRFIQLVIDGVIETRQRSKQEVAAMLREHKLYDPDELASSADADDGGLTPSMTALLRISLYGLTAEEVAKFDAKIAELRASYTELEATTPEQLWLRELRELRVEMKKFLIDSSAEEEDKELQKLTAAKSKGLTAPTNNKKKAVKKQKTTK